ncbi:MAG TPA: DNA polymerase I [Actinomycetota bacterium]|jgi:DNA polymerase-1|nr:DNA polymerase I [Actinomycetota bacterium]
MPSTKAPERKRIFLLDGHSLSFRAFFALPTTLATTTGQVTNAVYGFTSMLIKLLGEERPDLIAVAFDKGAPTVRLEKYADYKAQRTEAPDEFRQQLPLIREVLETLRVPIVEIEGHEADDAIATLAVRAASRGMEAVVVTADRDFFQLVGDGIRVMFNRKGISDIVMYDREAIENRFGLPPEKYLDYVALKGDPSDNIPGVPGVGEKTASRLVQQYGSVEDVVTHAAELPPKLRAGIQTAADQLAVNKDLARLETDLELPLDPDDCVMGEWDPDAVRRLFNSLEFRSLLERLEEIGVTKPQVEAAELELELAGERDLEVLLSGKAPHATSLVCEGTRAVGLAVSPGGGQSAYLPLDGRLPEAASQWLADPGRPKWVHDAKELQAAALRLGVDVEGVAFDTLLAGYLLEPGEAAYPLSELTRRYLGTDLMTGEPDEGNGAGQAQLAIDGTEKEAEAWRGAATEAAAVALLAPVLHDHVQRAGVRRLLEEVELPLASVLARMQAAGVALDVDYLRQMSEEVGDRMRALEAEIYTHAGEEFNIGSPQQLGVILYEKLRLPILKRTMKGRAPSTEADVLEKLRDHHPIVDALIKFRELAKLKSTYLDALPPLVSPEDGRLHTTFNQVAAATGRLSSVNPNLQNIPVRGELGRQIRKAFIPGSSDRLLLVADYSQIELRVLAHLSGDEGLAEAFASDQDIHAVTAAKVYRLPIEQVDPEMRRFAKMVNYGLAYGMNAYGLAQRLGIPPDEAQAFIDAYFAGFPRVREFLERQVGMAAAEGFTATILGRRRYLPELQHPNPRIRDLGRRMALNAPIQGSAADILKLAMIRVGTAVEELPAEVLLTVHDELVLEVDGGEVERVAAAVRSEMGHAYEMTVPLRVDVGWGKDWAVAAPAGH